MSGPRTFLNTVKQRYCRQRSPHGPPGKILFPGAMDSPKNGLHRLFYHIHPCTITAHVIEAQIIGDKTSHNCGSALKFSSTTGAAIFQETMGIPPPGIGFFMPPVSTGILPLGLCGKKKSLLPEPDRVFYDPYAIEFFDGLPGHVTHVPVLFGQERIDQKLMENGFQQGLKTLFIAEGLLMYIPPQAVDGLMAFITAASSPDSVFVADYFPLDVIDGTSPLKEDRVLRQFVENEGSTLMSRLFRPPGLLQHQSRSSTILETGLFQRRKYKKAGFVYV